MSLGKDKQLPNLKILEGKETDFSRENFGINGRNIRLGRKETNCRTRMLTRFEKRLDRGMTGHKQFESEGKAL